MIPELRHLIYEERLKECGLTTIETRRVIRDQIEIFRKYSFSQRTINEWTNYLQIVKMQAA